MSYVGSGWTHDQLATAYLLRAAEPPAPAVGRLVAAVGAEAAARAVRHGAVDDAVAAETAPRRHLTLAEADLSEAHQVGARLVTPADTEWPTDQFADLTTVCNDGADDLAPPLGLWVRGTQPLADLVATAVTITGSRAATGYGEHVATELAHGLAERDVTVVSGAAYGIDGAAHRGALAADVATVAVLPCGLDIAYPLGHTDLLRRIGEHGALISEYPPGTVPARHRFGARSRLLAALARAVVLVEAGRRTSTAPVTYAAGALDRAVLAVPGPVTSAQSVRPHELIRSGHARLVTTPAEIAAALSDDTAPAAPWSS